MSTEDTQTHQDIRTAPRDGTQIMLERETEIGIVEIGSGHWYINPLSPNPMPVGFWQAGHVPIGLWPPTHWRPIG